LLALGRQFAGPTVAVLAANMLFLFIDAGRVSPLNGEAVGVLVWAHVLLGGFLLLDLWALSWVGMWLGLNHQKPNRAALLALTRILVLPFVFYCVGMTLWGAAGQLAEGDFWVIAIGLWIFGGLAMDLFFGLTAKVKLLEQFRKIASEGTKRKRVAVTGPPPAPAPAEAR
jgi:hypothetical protein